MRRLRLGLLGMIAGAVVVVAGCQSPIKVLSRGEFEHLKGLEALNANQSAMISSLLTERDTYKTDNERLQQLLGAKDAIIQAREKAIEDLSKGVPSIDGASVVPTKIGPAIRVGSDLLFDPGKAELKPEGQKILKEIANIIADKPNRIAVCGYTDSTPIQHSSWESNFELSGARALAVLNFLVKQGISSDKLEFAGFGSNNLIMENGAENKAKSRRAEIVLLDEGVDLGNAAPGPAMKEPVKPAHPKAKVPK